MSSKLNKEQGVEVSDTTKFNSITEAGYKKKIYKSLGMLQNGFVGNLLFLSKQIFAIMQKEKQILTPEEKQEKVHKIIAEWKKRRAEDEAEIREKVKTPEFKTMINELKKRNAKKGIVTPGI